MTASDRRDLLKRLQQSSGEAVLRELRELQAIAYIFAANADELRQLLTASRHPPAAFRLWSLDNAELFDQFLHESDRLLHNLLASVISLVDHTRNFMRANYAGHPVFVQYQERVAALFTTSGEARFVQQLRHYMLHKGIPPTNARLSGQGPDSSTIKSAIYLDLGEVRQWTRWEEPARSYVMGLTEEPDLLDLVNSYETRARQLYDWLSDRLQEIHAAELAEHAAILKELDSSD